MQPLVVEAKRTIARARRSRQRISTLLDAIEYRRALMAEPTSGGVSRLAVRSGKLVSFVHNVDVARRGSIASNDNRLVAS